MTTINQLSAVSALTAGDLLPVFVTGNGDCRKASVSVVTAYVSQNLGDALGTSLVLDSYVRTKPFTVANLPSAATVGEGSRAFVSDANATLTAGIGAIVAAGGSNKVPVVSDGTNWRIG